MTSPEIKPVLILAPWGSGSSAVTGFIDRCGAYSCPPHFATNDPRTPNAFESQAYRKAVMTLFDELTLQQIGDPKAFVAFFDIWWDRECAKARTAGQTHIVLKYALQTLVLPYLHKRLDPAIICVTRPLNEIERTRKRRNWHMTYGARGAKALYDTATDYLVAQAVPYLSVPFSGFRTDATIRRKLLQYIDLEPTADVLRAAEAGLRPPAKKA